jgi:hypothetical protein
MSWQVKVSIFNIVLGALGYLLSPNPASAVGMVMGAVGIGFYWGRK